MQLKQLCVGLLIISISRCAVGSYNFKTQGSDWTGVCSTGTAQSPIDIVTSKAVYHENRRIYIDWNHDTLFSALTKKDYTIQQDGKWLTLNVMDDKGQIRVYEGVQFHFHTKSDHTINGKYYDAELHIVCQETATSIAANGADPRIYVALGFLFNIGKTNRFFKFIDYSKVGQTVSNNGEITFGDMIASRVQDLQSKGKRMQYYQYAGSLTTPGCDEVVTHIVLDQQFSISKAQIDSFRNAFSSDSNWGDGNYRSIQPLNGRVVTKGDVVNDHMIPRFDQRKEGKYIAALFVVLFILVVILFVGLGYSIMKIKELRSSRSKQYEQVKTEQVGTQEQQNHN